MPSRIYVAGSSHILETVTRALPEMAVLEAPPSNHEASFWNADCLMIGPEHESLLDTVFERMPVVGLLTDEAPLAKVQTTSLTSDRVPRAHAQNPSELRLAMRSATLECRARRLLADLTGAWSHDARGALGVAQLALKLMEMNADSSSPIPKAENGLTRLGYLVERIPSQLALALDLPLLERSSATLFPTLEAFVRHLRRIHPRRSVELLGENIATNQATARLVPFAAGFVEFALKLSDAQSVLKMTLLEHLALEFECDPIRPHPWGKRATLDASNIGRSVDEFLPYRLVEACRLATRLGAVLTLELTERSLFARVQLA